MATDVDAVFLDWGKPTQKAIHRSLAATASMQYSFPAGSMGPKVEAACHFAEATGKAAAIGALADIRRSSPARPARSSARSSTESLA